MTTKYEQRDRRLAAELIRANLGRDAAAARAIAAALSIDELEALIEHGARGTQQAIVGMSAVIYQMRARTAHVARPAAEKRAADREAEEHLRQLDKFGYCHAGRTTAAERDAPPQPRDAVRVLLPGEDQPQEE